MEYDLELDRITNVIRKEKALTVCIQLPDGLKPKADIIQEEIEKKTGAAVLIWAASTFGACDVPTGLKSQGVDMLIQWGHSEWRQK